MKGRVFAAMFDDDIGKKIAVLRKACNVSATELSLAIGKKSHYIYGIEKGYFKPSTGAYFDICGYLGIPALIMTDSSLEEFEKL